VLFKTFFLAFLLISSWANEDKKELFKDKYLNSQKLNQYKDTNINTSADLKISNIKEMTKRISPAKKNTSKIINNSLKSDKLKNEAHRINTQVKSKDFQKKIIENEDYLLYDKKMNWQKHLGKYKDRTNIILKQLKDKGSISSKISSNQFLANDEKLFIIISSSIPKYILKNYFDMLQKVNTDVTFVLRGTIGGIKKIKPTLKYIQDLLLLKGNNKRYEYNIIIEPRIESKYKIQKVPAVLFIKNYNLSYTKEDQNERYYIYYGAIGIEYVLKKINESAKSLGLKNILSEI